MNILEANPDLPLGDEEQRAYASIDSTKTLDVVFRPGGVGMTIGGGGDVLGTLLEYADVAFNRVEGFHLGVNIDKERVTPWLSIKAGMAYGFSDKRTKYLLGLTVFPFSLRTVGLGAEVYRRIDHRPDFAYYSPLTNSLTALLAKGDYNDYYETEGWRCSSQQNRWQD